MAKLSKAQIDVIKQGAMEGTPLATLTGIARKLGPVTQAEVAKIVEPDIAVRDQKREAKKEGTDLLGKFVQNARDGAEVDDMAALIEHALYRDILRRYAEGKSEIDELGISELFKLDLSYRKVRLTREKAEKSDSYGKKMERWAATYSGQLFDKVAQLAEKKGADIAPLKKELMAWVKRRFSSESFDEAEMEQKQIEQLNDYLARKQNGADSKRTTNKEPAHGFVG